MNSITIFISYKHDKDDEKILDELYDYISQPVVLKGAQIWTDKKINPGEFWDKEIKKQLNNSDIAILLISQKFLASNYIQNEEVATFIKKRKEEGLVIFPIIISPCTWELHEWLRNTQFLPKGGKTIEVDYVKKGIRKALYKDITNELIGIIENLRQLYEDIEKNIGFIFCTKCKRKIEVNTADNSYISLQCKYCQAELKIPPQLRISDRIIYLYENTEILPFHLDIRKYKLKAPIATVERHPNHSSIMGLKNNSNSSWTRISFDGRETKIEPGKTMMIKIGIKILFNEETKGEILDNYADSNLAS